MHRISVFLASAALLFALSCNSAPDSIRIGYVPLSSNLPLFVAMSNGYFAARGLKPELVPFQTSNALTEALVAGNIDAEAGASTVVTLTVAQTAADRLRVLLGIVVTPEHSISAVLVPKDSPVRTVPELRGKRIGCFPGSAIKLFTRLYLTRLNAYDDNTMLVELPPTLQLQALESGSIDALLALEPTPTLGAVSGVARTLDVAPIERELLNPWVGGVYSVGRNYEKAHPETVEKFTAALRDAVEFIAASSDSAKKTMSVYTPIRDTAVLKRLPVPTFVMADRLPAADFQKLADVLAAQGILKKPVDVSALLK